MILVVWELVGLTVLSLGSPGACSLLGNKWRALTY